MSSNPSAVKSCLKTIGILCLQASFQAVAQTLPPLETWGIVERNASTTTREFVESINDEIMGETSTKTHRVVEVASGLNYVDSSGTWQASEDVIELTPDGSAKAVKGQHKVHFGRNFAAPSVISLIDPNGVAIRTHVLGIFFFDYASGKSALLATPKRAVGQLLPPNQLLYRSAFDGINADMRYTYTKLGFESDVIFRTKLPSPESFGLDPATTRLEVWHEWLDTPTPMCTPIVVQKRSSSRIQAGQPIIDHTIQLGDWHFPVGTGFVDSDNHGSPYTQAQINFPYDDNPTPVGKTWHTIDGRNVMIEGMDWDDVNSLTAELASHRGLYPTGLQRVYSSRVIPNREYLNSSEEPITIASAPCTEKGFVLDYITIYGGSYTTNMQFNTGQTYYISGSVLASGVLTFNPGCVLKYQNGVTISLSKVPVCNGTQQNPSVLTSKDDPSVGEIVSTGCPTYSASTALSIHPNVPGNVVISGFKIRWATTAIHLGGASCVRSHTVSNCSIQFCQNGIRRSDCNLTISGCNALDVTAPVVDQAWCSPISGTLSSSTSLASHIASGAATLTSGHNYLTDKPVFTDSTYSVYNQNSLIYGKYGYTALAVSNSSHTAWYQGAMTLITPRHAVMATHMAASTNGSVIRFVDRNNSHHVVTVLGRTGVPSIHWDACIVLLSASLPSGVDRVSLFPLSAYKKLILTNWTCTSTLAPAIAVDQAKRAFVKDVNWLIPWTAIAFQDSSWFPSWTQPVIGGDSGHPVYFLINNQLVLGATITSTTAGPWYGVDISAVNSAITALDQSVLGYSTGFQTSGSDLSSFPDL